MNTVSSKDHNTLNSNEKSKLYSQSKYADIFKNLSSIVRGTLIILIFFITETLAFSQDFIVIKNTTQISIEKFEELSTELKNFSFFIFIVSTAFSTIFFTFFTGIQLGVTGTLITEYRQKVLQIAQIVFEEFTKNKGDEEVNVKQIIFTIYIILVISSFLVSFFSFVIYKYDFCKYLNTFPTGAINIVMTYIGITMLLMPFETLPSAFENNAFHMYIAMILTIISGCLMFLIDSWYGFTYLMPVAVLASISLFQIVKLTGIIKSPEIFNLYIVKNIDSSIIVFVQHLEFSFPFKLFKVLQKTFSIILTGVIFNMIHLNINIPTYSSTTKIKVNMSREYLAQGITNLLCMFLGFPVYFCYCYSAYLHSMDCYSKISSYLASFLLILASFFINNISSYVPKILGPSISFYLGLSFIYSNFFLQIFDSTLFDNVILCLGVILSIAIDVSFGFIFGIAASNMAFCLQLSQLYYREVRYNFVNKKSNLHSAHLKKKTIIDYPICFSTTTFLIEDLEYVKEGGIVDLTLCQYIDRDGNIALIEFLQEHSIGNIKIIGKPFNINENKLGEFLIND